MMAFKLTPDQLAQFLANPTPENLKAIVEGDSDAKANAKDLLGIASEVLGIDGNLAVKLAAENFNSGDQRGMRNAALKCMELLASPKSLASPEGMLGTIADFLGGVFQGGYASALSDAALGKVDPNRLKVDRAPAPIAAPPAFETPAQTYARTDGNTPKTRPSYKRNSKR